MRLSPDTPLFGPKETRWEGTAGELMEMLSVFRSSSRYSTVGTGRWLNDFIRTERAPWLTCVLKRARRKFYVVTREEDEI